MADSLLSLGMAGDSEAQGFIQRVKSTERMVAWADAIGPKLAAAIRKEAPVSTGPGGGTLRDSIRYQRSSTVGGVVLKFHTNVSYAPYVVEGTPAHAIDARIKLALHWVGGDGTHHFAKHVWHPETPPNQFPERALKKMLPEITTTFMELFEEP